MVRYRRESSPNPNGEYFLTIVTKDRQRIFNDREDVGHLNQALRYVLEQSSGDLIAWVVLPDHLHVILRQGSQPFSDLVSRIKRRINWHYVGNEGTIWQARFWEHRIRDEIDRIRHVEYIHYNPVKHGYVTSPRDWEYSSFREYVERGMYPMDWSEGASGEQLETGEP
ncbi:MAG: transposase [bacterium]